MLRRALVLFGLPTVLFAAAESSPCSDAMLSSGWEAQLRSRGFATGQIIDWLGVTGYQAARDQIVKAAAHGPSRELFFRKDLRGAEEAHAVLAAGMGRIARAALEPFVVPPEFRDRAALGVTFLRTYVAGTPSIGKLEDWHQDGGYVQVLLAVDGPGPRLWQGWLRSTYRLAPGEFAVYVGTNLAKPLGLEVPFLRLPRRHRGRADALFRSPWLWGE